MMLSFIMSLGSKITALPPVISLPINISPPSILISGETLTVVPGTWTNADSFTYSWKRDGVSVGTGTTYGLNPIDNDTEITVVETAINTDGSADTESAPFVPVEPVLAEVDETTGVLSLAPHLWLDAQVINTGDAAQYSSGVVRFDDSSGDNNDATQATLTNRPTVDNATINGHASKQRVIFDGVDNYLITPLTGAGFCDNPDGFEVHIHLNSIADGRPATNNYLMGTFNGTGNAKRFYISIDTLGQLNCFIGNLTDSFNGAQTNVAYFANGVIGPTYMRFKINFADNTIKIYAITPGLWNNLTIPLALKATVGSNGDITAINPANWDNTLPFFIGAVNASGSPSNYAGVNLVSLVITPLLTDGQANNLCNQITNFDHAMTGPNFVTVSIPNEITHIEYTNGEYRALSNFRLPTEVPTYLYKTSDFLINPFVEFGSNPVFNLPGSYSWMRSVAKIGSLFVGMYTDHQGGGGEDTGIATSPDDATAFEVWTDLGTAIENSADIPGSARAFGGPMRYDPDAGLYYMMVSVSYGPEVDESREYRIELWSSPNLTGGGTWSFVNIVVNNSGVSSGPNSGVVTAPGPWLFIDGNYYIFYLPFDNSTAIGTEMRMASSTNLLGPYTELGLVIEDHLNDGGNERMYFACMIEHHISGEDYLFYSMRRDQTPALYQVRRVKIMLP